MLSYGSLYQLYSHFIRSTQRRTRFELSWYYSMQFLVMFPKEAQKSVIIWSVCLSFGILVRPASPATTDNIFSDRPNCLPSVLNDSKLWDNPWSILNQRWILMILWQLTWKKWWSFFTPMIRTLFERLVSW